MNAIGGYFQLELRNGTEYHADCIALNSARNALGLLLQRQSYNRIWLPYYICEDALEPVFKLKMKYEFYNIDTYLNPIYPDIEDDDLFVAVNYFGLKNSVVDSSVVRFKNVVVDNTQAFYYKTLYDSFYSCRKFFGVPDGAYLKVVEGIDANLEIDSSYFRTHHLLKRIECGAEKNYHLFKKSEESLVDQPIKQMSNLTKALLRNIDYEHCAKVRRENFTHLHTQLKDLNELKFDLDEKSVPMVYPFLLKSEMLRKKLIDNKIYVATYWNNKCPFRPGSWEEYLAKYLIPLPIDQRYGINEMDTILGVCYEI